MNRNLFLIDGDLLKSYDDLTTDISNEQFYYPLLKSSSLYEQLKNVIKSVLSGKSLTLIDSDLSENELKDVDLSILNKPVEVSFPLFSSITEIINLVRKSKSEITIFTSGTTGQPKKVVHSFESLTRNIRVSEKYNDQLWAFAYNPTHMAGIQVFFQAFLNHNVIINVFNKSREYIYIQIEKYQISHISATPTFYRLLLPVDESYSSVVRITFGGEKSDERLYRKIQQIFPNAKVNNIYASTEAGSLFVSNGDIFKVPLDIVNLVKFDNNEILLHKDLLGSSEGFLFENDYYKTGDIIEWHNESLREFRIKNRKNELINVGGYKVNPNEIEAEILLIDGVDQVRVYGKNNSVLGNILCADVQLSAIFKSSVTEKSIIQNLGNKLQDYKIPRIIKFVNSIQLTRTGKLKRS